MIRTVLTVLLGLMLVPAPAAPGPAAAADRLAGYDHFFHSFIVREPLHLILVEKKHQRLSVLENSKDGLREIATYFCATGEGRGRKKMSGDSRTPEGIYFVNKIYNDNKVTVFGRKALHLDYPNIFDRQAGHNGDGIYIHGTNRSLKPFSTNGCITLRNRDLEKMVRFLRTDLTPVVIVPGLQELKNNTPANLGTNPSARARALVLPESVNPRDIEFTALYRLNYGSQAVVVGSYLHNRKNFSRLAGYSRTYLAQDREGGWRRLNNIRDSEPMHFKLALRTPEPVQDAPSPAPESGQQQTTEIGGAGQKTQERTAAAGSESPRPAREAEVNREPEGYPRDRQEIAKFVETWRRAWQAKDLETYIGSYARTFHRGRQDLDDYRRYKRQLNRRYDFIRVTIDDLQVTWTGEGASVSFHQIYNSDQYHAEGRKILKLVYNDQAWRIKRELWVPAE